MFQKIEQEFKNQSEYRKNSVLLIIFSIAYILLASYILNFNDNVWFIVCLAILLYIIIYVYIVCKNIKIKVYSKKEWWKVFYFEYSIKTFLDNQRKKDIKLLDGILKEAGFDNKTKIDQLIEHYRVYIPRSINGGGAFISVLAVFISIGTFIYDQNANIVNEKALLISEILIIVILGWFLYITISKLIVGMLGRKAFYLRLEDLLTEIYINYKYPRKKKQSTKMLSEKSIND